MGVEIMSPPGMEEMTNQLQGMFQNLAGDTKKKRKMKIKDAFKALTEEEASKLVNQEELKRTRSSTLKTTVSYSSMRSTKSVSVATAQAQTYLAKVFNVTYCLLSKAAQYQLSTVW